MFLLRKKNNFFHKSKMTGCSKMKKMKGRTKPEWICFSEKGFSFLWSKLAKDQWVCL